jgi:hypothetical protein
MAATIFLHVTSNDADKVPNRLVERLSLQAAAAPPDQQQISEKVGETNVDRREVVMISPPLKGSNYLAADSCCDAPHIHRKSPLPINGQFTLAQRYAVDYEQLDADNRVYSGEKADLSGYTIYGKEALAVADGTVVKVTDGYPEQNPGVFPKGISLDEADGNSPKLPPILTVNILPIRRLRNLLKPGGQNGRYHNHHLLLVRRLLKGYAPLRRSPG